MKPGQSKEPKPAQAILFGNIVPTGSGNYAVVPQKPVAEIPSSQAAKVLNVSRGTLSNIINSKQGQKYLRWRWLTPAKGKRLFESESVIAYRDASKDSEFGDERPQK